MSARDDAPAGTHVSERASADVVRTTIHGRVNASMIRAWGDDWTRLHAAPSDDGDATCARVWFFDAMRIVSYTPDAVSEATRLMMRLKGLRAIVVASRSTLVKIGATVVHKALRATTGVDVQVFDSLEAAEVHLRATLAKLGPST